MTPPRAFYSCPCPAPTAWASTRAVRRSPLPCNVAGRRRPCTSSSAVRPRTRRAHRSQRRGWRHRPPFNRLRSCGCSRPGARRWSSSTMPGAPRSCGRRRLWVHGSCTSAHGGASVPRRSGCAGCARSTNIGSPTRSSSPADSRALERLKLRLLRRPTVRYLDVICSRPTPERRAALMSDAGCSPGAYVLVVPGGGTGHPGADDAVEQFLAAARRLAADGIPTVFVGPASPAAPDAALDAKLRLTGALPQSDLAGLMSGARVVITNGGSTLLQAIAGGAACVAVPIASDQIGRIRRCVRAGVAIDAALDAASIFEKASALLNDEPARAALAQRAAGLGLADGIEVAARCARQAARIDVARAGVSCRMHYCWATISISRHFGTACAVSSASRRRRVGRCASSAFRGGATDCAPGSGARCSDGRMSSFCIRSS